MPQSFGQVYVHLVLATEDHAPLFADAVPRGDLYRYMNGILRNQKCDPVQIGGADEHVHVLCRLPRIRAVGQVASELKTGTAAWLRAQQTELRWQEEYGAFSVTAENVGKAIQYIENEQSRHRSLTFEDEYERMAQRSGGREHAVAIHLVFSTKNRVPSLTDKTVRELLHRRLAVNCERAGCSCLRVGGVEDHVHILYLLAPERTLAQVTQAVKTTTSAWLATEHRVTGFDWQDGYGAFSVSPQDVPVVTRYIDNQEEHHRRESSEAEFKRLQQPRRFRTAVDLWEQHSPG